MRKRQICFTLDEATLQELETLKEETGLPLSKIVELRVKGYDIKKER